jgi:hypothetical protein
MAKASVRTSAQAAVRVWDSAASDIVTVDVDRRGQQLRVRHHDASLVLNLRGRRGRALKVTARGRRGEVRLHVSPLRRATTSTSTGSAVNKRRGTGGGSTGGTGGTGTGGAGGTGTGGTGGTGTGGTGGTGTGGSSSDPSGESMPTGNIPGWTQVFADNFTSSTDACWGKYSADPIPSSPTAAWDPSRVSIGGGMAVLNSSYDPALGLWASGGMSSAPCLNQAYGKYEVRFRMDKADGVKYAILLWPTSGVWPCGGEIDFGEDGGGNRSSTTLTDIYCDSAGAEQKLPQIHLSADFSQWQTLGVEWTPGKLVWTLNGQDVGEIDGSHVPSGPMQMDIQTESNTNCTLSWYSCMDSTTPANVNLDVDWVVAYKPAS